MKKLKILLALITGVILIVSCRKEQVEPPVNNTNKPQNMSQLVASTTFDWKTTKDYTFTLSGNYNEVVTIKSASGVVFHKGFMKAGVSYKLHITLPASEKSVRLIYHGQDEEYVLTQQVINYTFNSKKIKS